MAGERSLLVRFGADLSPLEKAVVKAAKTTEKFGREVAGLGKNLSAAITVPIVGLGAAAIAASETLDDAMDKIRLGTGATGAALEGLGNTMRAVYGSVPVTASDAATAVADLNTRLGLTGTPLEEMSAQLLNLARITKSEVGPMVESTARVFNNWGVSTRDQSAVLDQLWKVSQATGVGVQKLADDLSEGGAALRALGVPVGTAVALLGGFEKAGVAAETMVGGLTKAASKLAKEGVDMTAGLSSAIAVIKAAPSDSAAATLAVETFGKSGLAMADAIRRGTFDVDKFVASLTASGESINRAAADTDGLGEAFAQLKNKATLALEPLGIAMTQAFLGMMPVFTTVINGVKLLVDAFAALPQPVQSSIVVLGLLAVATGPALIAIGGLIIGAAHVVTSLVALKASGLAAITSISTAYVVGTATIGGAWATMTGALAFVPAIFTTLAAGVATAGAALLAFVTSPITLTVAALALVAYKWDWLREKLIAAAGLIKVGLVKMWENLKYDCAVVWTAIKSAVTSFANAIVVNVKDYGAALLATAKAVLGDYYDVIVDMCAKAWDWVSKTWNQVKAEVEIAGEQIAKAFSQALEKMRITAQEMIAVAASAAATAARLIGLGGAASALESMIGPSSPPVLAGPKGSKSSAPTSPTSSSPAGASGATVPIRGEVERAGNGNGQSSSSDQVTISLADITMKTTGNLLGAQGPSRAWLYTQQDAVAAAVAKATAVGPSVIRPPGGVSYIGGYSANPIYAPTLKSPYATNPVYAPTLAGSYAASPIYAPTLKGAYAAFAAGGIVTSPMLGLVGEAGPEAIIPLGSSRASGLAGLGNSGNVTVNVHVNGSVSTQSDLADQIRRSLIRMGQRNGTTGLV